MSDIFGEGVDRMNNVNHVNPLRKKKCIYVCGGKSHGKKMPFRLFFQRGQSHPWLTKSTPITASWSLAAPYVYACCTRLSINSATQPTTSWLTGNLLAGTWEKDLVVVVSESLLDYHCLYWRYGLSVCGRCKSSRLATSPMVRLTDIRDRCSSEGTTGGARKNTTLPDACLSMVRIQH